MSECAIAQVGHFCILTLVWKLCIKLILLSHVRQDSGSDMGKLKCRCCKQIVVVVADHPFVQSYLFQFDIGGLFETC